MQTSNMLLVYVLLVQIFISSILGLRRNDLCTTPDSESGRCIPVKSCSFILSSIQSGNSERIRYAQQSQCGYENGPLVCCAITVEGPEQIFSHRLLPNKDTCGIEKTAEKIVGGSITKIDEFPWMALIRYMDTDTGELDFRCGGTLINNRYTLTAAHCLVLVDDGLSLHSVRLGEWRISTREDCEGKTIQRCSNPPLDINIQQSIPHPRYSRRTKDNDIGLIRLQRSVNFNDFIQPICLPPPNTVLPTVANFMAAGWGLVENRSNSDVKLKVALPLVSTSDCSARIGNRGRVTDNQFCAGGVPGKDSCNGDSGGPLMNYAVRNSEVQWIQEGVISWGVSCGIAGYPAVYTKVSRYSTWIVNSMSP